MNVEKLFAEMPTFETERLFLRPFSLDDVNDYYELASDPLVTIHTIWEAHRTLTESKQYIENILERYEAKSTYHLGIIEKAVNKLIGRTGFVNWDANHHRAEVGFALSSNQWNRGIVTEATLPLIRYGFEELGLNRIEGRCNYDNIGSGRVMEKLGMKCEGILREQLLIKGRFVDQKMYSIIKGDYLYVRLD